jgi:hypothetical protein
MRVANIDDFSQLTEIPPPGFDVDSCATLTNIDLSDTLSNSDDSSESGVFEMAGHSPVGLRMVEIATSQIGVCESGSNSGIPLQRYVRPFLPGSGPQPWCAFFVSWCYLQTTRSRPPWSNAGWVPSVYAWAENNGQVVRTPLRGDMFGIAGNHMGLVARSLSDHIITIEGNTGSGCVAANQRPLSGLWFARPA